MKNKGYLKHKLCWVCPICIYYKIKEMITGNNYNLNKELKEGGGE